MAFNLRFYIWVYFDPLRECIKHCRSLLLHCLGVAKPTPTSCADRPLLPPSYGATFSPGLWRQMDERRGSQQELKAPPEGYNWTYDQRVPIAEQAETMPPIGAMSPQHDWPQTTLG